MRRRIEGRIENRGEAALERENDATMQTKCVLMAVWNVVLL